MSTKTKETFELRKWQKEALEIYRKAKASDFLVVATPGAGKTTFALTVAEKLLGAKRINTVIIVAPTDHLRTQWSEAAVEKGIFLDPSLKNNAGLILPDFDGYVSTYAEIGNNVGIHKARANERGRKTLVIFDEIHHAGDGYSWGNSIKIAFNDVTRRLSLTGTPFRTGSEFIPFITYEEIEKGISVSKPDYTFGYGEALEESVVRPVSFAAYSGETTWSNSANDVVTVKLGDETLTAAQELKAWTTALDPKGAWIKHVIQAADERLTHVRNAGMSNAGAMILAGDQEKARAYAKIVQKISGTKPTIVLSDDRKASNKITEFSNSKNPDDRWLVAVRMVSEGVDVPRLAVGVWATKYKTSLFFAQAIGRFVRLKQKGETATVFLPAVRPLLALAATMEEQRNHVIQAENATEDENELLDPMMDEEEPAEPNEGEGYEALSADAEFAHVLYNGRAYDGSLNESDVDYIGLPGLLPPDEIATLLQKRDDDIRRKLGEPMRGNIAVEEKPELNPIELQQLKLAARKDISRLVGRAARKTGMEHSRIHSQARRAVPGPPSVDADIDILNQRIEWLEML